jgi:hypothetical protein
LNLKSSLLANTGRQYRKEKLYAFYKYISTFCILLFFIQTNCSAQLYKLDISTVQEFSEDRRACRTKALEFVTNSTNNISLAIPLSLLVTGAIKNDKDMRKKALLITESLALSTGITFAMKYTFKRQRPYTKDTLIIRVGPGGGYSFPSGHTSQAFSVATSLSMAYPKWYVIAPAYLWAGTVAFSRMYLGVHYPSDILAGAIVGSGSAILTYKINKWLTNSKEPKKLTAFIY